MNRSLTIALVVMLCLLSNATSSYAQSTTPTPSAQPLLIFTENAHTATSLIFTVNLDSTATLAIEQGRNNDQRTIWQETDPITSAQVASVNALFQTLPDLSDSYWDGDYRFDFPSADGHIKPLELYQGDAHTDASEHDTLQKALQTMLDIRKPFEPLVIFGWSGGFAPRSMQLVIKADGSTTYGNIFGKTNVKGQIAPSDLQTLRKLLQNVSFAATPRRPSVCADCFVYSISVLNEKGLQTVSFDDSTLGNAPQAVQDLVALLRNLSEQQASLPTATTAPTESPTSADSCCVETVEPGS